MQRIHVAIPGVVLAVAVGSAVFIGSGVRTDVDSFRALPGSEAESELVRISADEGPEAAWQFLKRALMPNGSLVPSKSDPHLLAHVVGEEIYRRGGTDGIRVCDEAFTFGCYHGYVRAMLEAGGDKPENASVCELTSNFGSCLHGFGHALGSIESGDVRAALGRCDVLFTEFTFACWEGVFMEFVKTYPLPAGSDLWQVCSTVDEKYREQCAKSLPGRLSSATVATVAAFCGRGSTATMRQACADAFGADVVHRAQEGAEKAVEACSLLAESLRFYCFSSAARLVVQRAEPDGLTIAYELCDYVPDRIADCLQEIKNVQESSR